MRDCVILAAAATAVTLRSPIRVRARGGRNARLVAHAAVRVDVGLAPGEDPGPVDEGYDKVQAGRQNLVEPAEPLDDDALRLVHDDRRAGQHEEHNDQQLGRRAGRGSGGGAAVSSQAHVVAPTRAARRHAGGPMRSSRAQGASPERQPLRRLPERPPTGTTPEAAHHARADATETYHGHHGEAYGEARITHVAIRSCEGYSIRLYAISRKWQRTSHSQARR